MNLENKKYYKFTDYKKLTSAKQLTNYHQLLQAVCHMDDTSNLDERSYFLTAFPRPGMDDDFSRLAYSELNRKIAGRSRQSGSYRIGMTWNEDWVGTRYGQSAGYGKHYHAIVILPKDTLVDDATPKETASLIEVCINDLDEFEKVDCQVYELNQPLSDVLDYSSKYDRQDSYNGSKRNVVSRVLPYDHDLENARQYGAVQNTKSFIRYNQRLTDFYTDASCFFSERYFHEFGEDICQFCRDNPLKENVIEAPPKAA